MKTIAVIAMVIVVLETADNGLTGNQVLFYEEYCWLWFIVSACWFLATLILIFMYEVNEKIK